MGVEHYSKSEDSTTEKGATKKIHQVSSERNNPIKITIKTTTLGPSYNQETSTKSVRKRKIKENGLKGDDSKSHRGGASSETTSLNQNGKKGDSIRSDDDIEVSVKEKHSSDRCSISVHFDKHTKRLWQDLHHPYGNYSSFFRHLLLLEKYWRNGDLSLSGDAQLKSSNYLRSVQNRIDAYEKNHKRSEQELSAYTRPNLSDPAPPTLLHTLESTLDVFSGPMQRSPPILASTHSGTSGTQASINSYPPNIALSPSYNKSPSRCRPSEICDSSTILKVPKIAVSLSRDSLSNTPSSAPSAKSTADLTVSKSPDVQQVSPPSLPTKIRVRTDLMHLGLMEKQKVDPSPNLMAANPELELLKKSLGQSSAVPKTGPQGSSSHIKNHQSNILQPLLSIAVSSPKVVTNVVGTNVTKSGSIDKYRGGQTNLMQMLNDPPLKVIVPPGLKQVDKEKSIIASLSGSHSSLGKLPASTTYNKISPSNSSLSTSSSSIGMSDAIGHTQSSNKHLFQNCSNSGSSAIPLTFNNSIAEVLAAAKKAKEQSVSPSKLSNILRGGTQASTLPKPDVTITAKSVNKHPTQSSKDDYLQKQQHANKSSNRMNISFQNFMTPPQGGKGLGLSSDLSTSSAATLAELQKSAAENATRLYNEAINNPLLDMNKLLHTQPPAVAPHLVAQNSLSNLQTLGSSGGITIPIIQTSTTVAGHTSVSTTTSKSYSVSQQSNQIQQQQPVGKKNINNILDRLSVRKSNPGTSSYSGLPVGDASGNLAQHIRTSSSISPKSNDSIRKSIAADFTSGGSVTASPSNNLVAQSQAQQRLNSELSMLLGLTSPATSLGQLSFPMSSLTGNTSVTSSSSSCSRVTQSTQSQAAAAAQQQQNQAQQAAQAALLMAGAGLPGMNQVAAAAAMQELMKISLTQQQHQPSVSLNAGTSAGVLQSALTQQLEQHQELMNSLEANPKQNPQSNVGNNTSIQSLKLRAPPPLTHMGKGGGSSNSTTKPT